MNVAMEGRKGDEARRSDADNQEASSGPPH
jgi:hypothetical protein